VCERNEACKDNQYFCYSQLGESQKHEAAIKTADISIYVYLPFSLSTLIEVSDAALLNVCTVYASSVR